MKAKIVITLTAVFLLSVISASCVDPTLPAQKEADSAVSNGTAQTSEPAVVSNTPEVVSKATATQQTTPIPESDHAAVLDNELGSSAILKNGATLEDIAEFLNLSEKDLNEAYGDKIKWVRFDYTYSEYLYDDMGINIVCYFRNDTRDSVVKYIELDGNSIDFNGINLSMSFEEVMSILGKTEVLALEDGLPGLVTYELRYEYDGINLRIYSWDKEGNNGIYFSVVDDFLPEYRQIKITPEQISHYFGLSKEELKKELGEGEYNSKWLEYPQYGASFRFDDQGKQLYAMNLYANYQINDLKQGLSLKDTMEIMGKRKIKETETSEDGTIEEITYLFKNFRLDVWTLESEGWDACWNIRGLGVTDTDIYDED